MNDLKKIFERQDDPKKQEFLKEVVARGTLITDDPTADLLAYAAKKDEREKAEQTASSESDLTDDTDLELHPPELPTIPKELLDKCIRLARKIAGAK